MNNWRQVEIADIYSGLFDGPHATPTPSENGKIFLRIENITDDGHLDFSKITHISDEEYPRWAKRVKPRAKDIVFSYEATLGRYAIIPEGFEGCLGRRIALIRPDNNKAHYRFLHFYFFSSLWQQEIANYKMTGSTVDRIPLIKFPQHKILLPPLAIQRKIAATLSAYDDLIENNNRRIAILEKMAEELYREWFVRLRFPGHENVKIVKGVPEGWEVKKIGDLVTFDKGVSYSGEGLTETGTPMVNLKCFSINGGFRRDGVKPYSGPVREQHIIKAGDIVIANTDLTQAGDIIGNPAIVPEIGVYPQYYFSHHLNAVRLNSTLNYRYYFYHLFRSPSFKGYSKGCASGTTVLGFRQGDLEKFTFFYPGEKLIRNFDQLAQSLHHQIDILNKANDLQRESRDRLLSRLMSGKIDVEKLDISFPKSMQDEAAAGN